MIYWISRPLARKTRIYHVLKIIFVESTVNRLSVNGSLLHKKTVFGHKRYVFPAVWSKRTWKLTFFCFEPYDLLNSRPLTAKSSFCHGLKIIFLESTVNRLSVNGLLLQKRQSLVIKSKFFQLCDRKGRES
jgi:hypothetical protein